MSETTVRLANLVLFFDLQNAQLTITSRPAPPGKPPSDYRPVVLSFESLEQLLTARFMSSQTAKETP